MGDAWTQRANRAESSLSVIGKRKAERADGLVQRRPRYAASKEMNLKGPNVLQIELVRRTAKGAAELGDGVHIRTLCRRRQILDCHILNHAPTQWAHLGHRELPFPGWGEAPEPWQTEQPELSSTAHHFSRVSRLVQSLATLRRNTQSGL